MFVTAAQIAVSAVMKRTLLSGPPNVKFTAPGRPISPIRSPSGEKTWTPVEGGRVHPALDIDLDAVGESRGRNGDQARAAQVPAADDVERDNVVGPGDVVAPGLLIGTAVGHVQHRAVGGERQAVGLVEAVGHHAESAGRRVVAVDVIADLWLGAEALEVPVGGIREPQRAVRCDHDVVG